METEIDPPATLGGVLGMLQNFQGERIIGVRGVKDTTRKLPGSTNLGL